MTLFYRPVSLTLIALAACAFGQGGYSHRGHDESDRSSQHESSRSNGHNDSRSSDSRRSSDSPSYSSHGHSSYSSGSGNSANRYQPSMTHSQRTYEGDSAPSYRRESSQSYRYQKDTQVQDYSPSYSRGAGRKSSDSGAQERRRSENESDSPRYNGRGGSSEQAASPAHVRTPSQNHRYQQQPQSEDSRFTGRGGASQSPAHAESAQGSFSSRGHDQISVHTNLQSNQGSFLNRGGQGGVLSNNNFAVHNRVAPPPVFRQVPINLQAGSLRTQVFREESISLTFGGFRFGYCQFTPFFQDSFFFGRRYLFDPCGPAFVFSPWYYYPCLPPYLLATEVIYITPPYYGNGYEYNWHRRYYDDDRYARVDQRQLDYAIDDLTDAFEHSDMGPVKHMVPRGGHVDILTDNHYGYSVRADDFYDMLRDAVEHTRTDTYAVVDVRTYDDGAVRIIARHNTTDPWGRSSHVYHSYRLCLEDGRYVIREFGTSYDRPY